MNIGQVANASGISAKMIRYYESVGLIPSADRSASGYRMYSQEDVHTLRFIRRARDLGFPVEQIAALLALWQDRSRASADVKKLALSHIEKLEAKRREIDEMVATLRHLASHCRGNNRPGCPIIDELAAGKAVAAQSPHRDRRIRVN